MRALTVEPGRVGSAAVADLPEPEPGPGRLVVDGMRVGVCGTDREIVAGVYGWAPPGAARLVLGHEAVGRVAWAPANAPIGVGDLVVGIVRRPDPVPCAACAVGQWDMCRNGMYREHGIKELDGFAAEQWTIDVDAAVAVPPALGPLAVLVEPASVVAKAWAHIDAIGARAAWFPSRVLVTGAGPIGLLAALFAVQRGHDVHVLDLVTDGPKPRLVAELGATYHSSGIGEACGRADIVVECTGVGALVLEAVRCTAPAGIVCLTGISSGGRHLQIDAGALNRDLVLENDVVFGSVNANAHHYRLAVDGLAAADPRWLEQLLSREVPLSRWSDALALHDHDVKVTIDLTR